METEQPQEHIMPLSRIIEILEELDKSFRDEIPTEMISGESEDRAWKVTKNWWQGAINALAKAKGYLDSQSHSDLITDIDQFNQDYLDDRFKDRLTTESDIERANKIMREVVNTLKNLQNST